MTDFAKESVALHAQLHGKLEVKSKVTRAPSWLARAAATFQNQINKVLAFPGVFRGALDAAATVINDQMKVSAARPTGVCRG